MAAVSGVLQHEIEVSAGAERFGVGHRIFLRKDVGVVASAEGGLIFWKGCKAHSDLRSEASMKATRKRYRTGSMAKVAHGVIRGGHGCGVGR